jgi:hypothetical protein
MTIEITYTFRKEGNDKTGKIEVPTYVCVGGVVGDISKAIDERLNFMFVPGRGPLDFDTLLDDRFGRKFSCQVGWRDDPW